MYTGFLLHNSDNDKKILKKFQKALDKWLLCEYNNKSNLCGAVCSHGCTCSLKIEQHEIKKTLRFWGRP